MRLAAAAFAVSLAGCAGAAEQIQNLETGLRTANEIALTAQRCTEDYIDTAIASCEELPEAERKQCLELVDARTEGARRLLEEWRKLRCQTLGGLGDECGSSAEPSSKP